MNFPDNLLYTTDHEWVRLEGDTATVGITAYAQSELGDIVYVEIETLDEELEKQAQFGSVEAVKTVSDLFMPLAGTVSEINPKLEDTHELVNSDPYGEGWMIKINVGDSPDTAELLSAEDYRKEIGKAG